MSEHKFSIIPGRAITDKRITDSIYRTLSALCGYANAKSGWCFPSQGALADDIGKTRKTINEHLQLLEEWGYIRSGKRTNEDGAPTSKMYQVVYDVPEITQPMSTPDYSAYEYSRGYTNDSSNDSSNNTASEEKPSSLPQSLSDEMLDKLPIEWQIKAGKEKIVMPDEKEMEILDRADLIAMGTGINHPIYKGIAYAFMKERGIIIPESKVKGQRKAVREMVEQGVLPNHAQMATRKLMELGYTVVDLFAISKTAIDLANPVNGPDFSQPQESRFESMDDLGD